MIWRYLSVSLPVGNDWVLTSRSSSQESCGLWPGFGIPASSCSLPPPFCSPASLHHLSSSQHATQFPTLCSFHISFFAQDRRWPSLTPGKCLPIFQKLSHHFSTKELISYLFSTDDWTCGITHPRTPGIPLRKWRFISSSLLMPSVRYLLLRMTRLIISFPFSSCSLRINILPVKTLCRIYTSF